MDDFTARSAKSPHLSHEDGSEALVKNLEIGDTHAWAIITHTWSWVQGEASETGPHKSSFNVWIFCPLCMLYVYSDLVKDDIKTGFTSITEFSGAPGGSVSPWPWP